MAYTIGLDDSDVFELMWSYFPPADAVVNGTFFVSDSLGDVSYNGLYPTFQGGVNGPFKYIWQAHAVVLASFNGQKWRILLKQNDVFVDQNLGPFRQDIYGTSYISSLRGDSTNEYPAIWGSYHESTGAEVDPYVPGAARPEVHLPYAVPGNYSQAFQGGSWLAYLGIWLRAVTAEPGHAQFSGCLTFISVSGGTGYVPNERITVQATNGTIVRNDCQLSVFRTRITSAIINNIGSGGNFSVSFQVQGTTGSGTKFRLSVTTDPSGRLLTVGSIDNAGVYSTNPTNLTSEPVQVVTDATNYSVGASNKVRLTVLTTNGLSTGQTVSVSIGYAESDGSRVITVIDSTTIDLDGTTYNSDHAGSVSGTILLTSGGLTGATITVTMGPQSFSYNWPWCGRYSLTDKPTAFVQTASTGSGTGITLSNPSISRQTAGVGIATLNANTFRLFENLKINGVTQGIDDSAQDQSTTIRGGKKRHERWNVIYHVWGNGSHGSGGAYPFDPEMVWIMNGNFWVEASNGEWSEPYQGANWFNHNLYIGDQNQDGDPSTIYYGVETRNCMDVRQSSSAQQRPGGVLYNTSFVAPCGGTTFNNYVEGYTAVASFNVCTDGYWYNSSNGSNEEFVRFLAAGGGYYYGIPTYRGALEITDNIVANETFSTGGQAFSVSGSLFATHLRRNIAYKWATATALAYRNVNNLINGNLVDAIVTSQGTGYTEYGYSTITGAERQGNSWTWKTNYVILQVDTGATMPDYVTAGYIEGIVDDGTGNFASRLNGKAFHCKRLSNDPNNANYKKIVIFAPTNDPFNNTDDITGNWLSGGRIVWGYLSKSITKLTGNGANASTHFIVVNGAVKTVWFGSGAGTNYGTNPGYGFANGDTFTCTLLGPGNNFVATVTKVAEVYADDSTALNGSVVQNGTNIWDDGSYIDAHPELFPYPGRNAGTFMDFVNSTSGSDWTDMRDALALQSKNTWNPWLTALSYNDYIREGFGKALLGSYYQRSLEPGNVPQAALTLSTTAPTVQRTTTTIGGRLPGKLGLRLRH